MQAYRVTEMGGKRKWRTAHTNVRSAIRVRIQGAFMTAKKHT